MLFQLVPGDFSYLVNQNNKNSNWKKNIGIWKHAGKVRKYIWLQLSLLYNSGCKLLVLSEKLWLQCTISLPQFDMAISEQQGQVITSHISSFSCQKQNAIWCLGFELKGQLQITVGMSQSGQGYPRVTRKMNSSRIKRVI